MAACGRAEQRRRLLPARLVVYFVLGLALFSPAPYLDVMRHLVEGLRGRGLLGEWHVPAKSGPGDVVGVDVDALLVGQALPGGEGDLRLRVPAGVLVDHGHPRDGALLLAEAGVQVVGQEAVPVASGGHVRGDVPGLVGLVGVVGQVRGGIDEDRDTGRGQPLLGSGGVCCGRADGRRHARFSRGEGERGDERGGNGGRADGGLTHEGSCAVPGPDASQWRTKWFRTVRGTGPLESPWAF
ncbi:transposase domain-containing protein [Streptomyces sp. NPDC001537]